MLSRISFRTSDLIFFSFSKSREKIIFCESLRLLFTIKGRSWLQTVTDNFITLLCSHLTPCTSAIANIINKMPSSTIPSSPISTLPVEILVMIFLFTVNSATPYIPYRKRTSGNNRAITFKKLAKIAPLRLSQVSRRWRDITRRTPKLWTDIHIIHLRPYYLPLLISHLIYSASTPLDITVHWRPSLLPLIAAGDKIRWFGDERDEEQDDTRALKDLYYQQIMSLRPFVYEQLKMLAYQVKRWRSFRLVFEDAGMMQAFIKSFSNLTAPKLTALDLRYILPPQVTGLSVDALLPNSGVALFAGIQGSNSIRSLHLEGVRLSLPLPSLRPLTTLSLHNMRPDAMPRLPELFDALRELPNLRRLYLHSFDSEDEYPLIIGSSNIVSLPALEKLSLADVPQGWAEYFIRHTNFPNVKKLALDIYEQEFDFALQELNTSHGTTPESHDVAPKFVLRSLEGLQLGAFGGCSRHNEVAVQEADFFSKLDNVRILLLNVEKHSDHISNVTKYTYQLTEGHDCNGTANPSTTCMPLLHTVFLRGIKHSRKKEIEDMVKAREEMGAPIRRLLIDRCCEGDRYCVQSKITDPDNSIHDTPFTTEDASWIQSNVTETVVFDEVRLQSREGINDTLDVLFEADGVVAADGNSKFVDVFRNMLKL